jgi:hypothetical protein
MKADSIEVCKVLMVRITDLVRPFRPSARVKSRPDLHGFGPVCCFARERDLNDQPSCTTKPRSNRCRATLTINLVEEDDTRLGIPGFFKQHPELTLRLADPLRQHICSLSHEEGCVTSALTPGEDQVFLPILVLPLLQDAARARARRVLPVPGGPWNRTPRGGVTPNC